MVASSSSRESGRSGSPPLIVTKFRPSPLLATIPGYITATSYEADGHTKPISYANGVTTTFSYSPQRRWLTRLTTAKGATVLLDN